MSPRTFLILLAATLIAVAAAAGAVLTRPGDVAEARRGQPVLPGLLDTVNDVHKVELVSDHGGALAFVRDGTAWKVANRNMYPASAEKLNALVVALARLTYLAPKTAKPELYSRLELGDPEQKGTKSVRVRLSDKGGRSMGELILGESRSVMEGSREGGIYFRVPGQAQAWLAAGAIEIGKPVFEWVDRALFQVPGKRIRRVKVTHPDGEVVEIEKRTPEDEHFTLKNLPAGKKVKNEFSVDGVASTIGEFLINDMAKPKDRPVDPAKAVRVVYETFDGLTVTALLEVQDVVKDGKSEKEYWVDVKVTGEGEAKAEADRLKARTDDWVYQVTDYRFQSIAKHLADLIEDDTGS